MHNFAFVIDLRIWHPSIDPKVISVMLGLVPKHQSRAGEPRITPKGQPLVGVYAESYWSADPFEHGKYLSQDDKVEDVLLKVQTASVLCVIICLERASLLGRGLVQCFLKVGLLGE
jgi:hypothetical protein